MNSQCGSEGSVGVSRLWEKEKSDFWAAQKSTINILELREGEVIADEKGEMTPKNGNDPLNMEMIP